MKKNTQLFFLVLSFSLISQSYAETLTSVMSKTSLPSVGYRPEVIDQNSLFPHITMIGTEINGICKPRAHNLKNALSVEPPPPTEPPPSPCVLYAHFLSSQLYSNSVVRISEIGFSDVDSDKEAKNIILSSCDWYRVDEFNNQTLVESVPNCTDFKLDTRFVGHYARVSIIAKTDLEKFKDDNYTPTPSVSMPYVYQSKFMITQAMP